MELKNKLSLVDSDGNRIDYFVRLIMWMNDKMPKEDEIKCIEIFDRAMDELREAFVHKDCDS